MKKKKKFRRNYWLFCVLAAMVLHSCISKIAFGNGDKWIPADFDAKNSVLLIQEAGYIDSRQKKVANFMKKEYPYQFEIIPLYDTVRFPDKAKYRFMLLSVNQKIAAPGTPGFNNFVNVTDFCFYDRLTGIRFTPLKKGSAGEFTTFRPVIKTIVKHSKK
jgi:hypothetical protein